MNDDDTRDKVIAELLARDVPLHDVQPIADAVLRLVDLANISAATGCIIFGLRATVAQLGDIADVCTYDSLGEVCTHCRCKRRPAS